MPLTTYGNLALPDTEQDRQKVDRYNTAINALASQVYQPWASWTPTWTNLSVGNGTVVAKYTQIGKTVFARLSIIFGSTTSVSGLVTFSLPVTRIAYAGSANITPLSVVRMLDTSASTTFEGALTNASTTTAAVVAYNAAATYLNGVATSSTVPFTWATGDEIGTEFYYEAA